MNWEISPFEYERSTVSLGIMTWNRFSHYWPFVRGMYRSPIDSPHKGRAMRSILLSLLLAWAICWLIRRVANGLRRKCHVNVITRKYWPQILYDTLAPIVHTLWYGYLNVWYRWVSARKTIANALKLRLSCTNPSILERRACPLLVIESHSGIIIEGCGALPFIFLSLKPLKGSTLLKCVCEMIALYNYRVFS